jgi:FAD/FMN-containing dehydrogenase
MTGTTFVLCYAVWDDPGDDARNESWHREMVESIEPMTIGRYIAEGDLNRDASAASAFAPPNWKKLQALKKQLDPDNVFHTYLG